MKYGIFFSYERIIFRIKGLKERYPESNLVPFAIRDDNDDIACFDIKNKNICILHDFSTDGYEKRRVYPNFEEWFKVCIKDMFEYI